MMHWGEGYGWMGVGWIVMALFWALVIFGIAALVRVLGTASGGGAQTPHQTPLEILEERYARGEIDRDEYQQKRADLQK